MEPTFGGRLASGATNPSAKSTLEPHAERANDRS
jgi:hypothetical protein